MEFRRWAVGGLLVCAVAGCGTSPPATELASQPPPLAASSTSEPQVRVLLFQAHGDPYVRSSYVYATRSSQQASEATERLEEAVTALVSGVTEEEATAGLASVFASAAVGNVVLAGVTLEDGRAVIDFAEGLSAAVPSAGTSSGGSALWAQLLGTVFAVPEVDSVTFQSGGDCAAFYALLEQECQTVTRSLWESHPLNPDAAEAIGG